MKKKLLFISAYNSSFVRNDLEILRKHYIVKVPDLVGKKKSLYDIFYSFFSILWGVLRSDIVFCWFAELPAFIATFFSRLFHKKCIVVVGGYEVANVPEIGYGGMLDPKNVKKVRYILKNADLTLAVSRSNLNEIKENFHTKRTELIYNGVRTDSFYPQGEKKNTVITVGNVTSENLQRKGLETFVRSAVLLPDTEFIVIGKHCDNSIKYLKSIASKNVRFTNFVSNEELLKWMQKAKIYVQISAHEAFGISLAEAMLCECIPVVTKRGALQEVAGDSAFYVPFGDIPQTAKMIRNALDSDNGKKYRKHIMDNFSLKNREEQLLNIIREIL